MKIKDEIVNVYNKKQRTGTKSFLQFLIRMWKEVYVLIRIKENYDGDEDDGQFYQQIK